MSIVLCCLALNEAEHLPKFYEQHRSWPGVERLIFVESADVIFARTNPALVSPDGLSVDGTTEYLDRLSREDSRVVHIKHGFCRHKDPAQGKCQARQRYLDVAEAIRPDFIMVADADELYTHAAQAAITNRLMKATLRDHAFIFKQRHIWRPPSISHEPLFSWEVRGGYWDVPHVRGWRWEPGLRYEQNHNWPQDRRGRLLTSKGLVRCDREPGSPECLHLGYSSSATSRVAKSQYYQARGEGREPGRIGRTRQMYVSCREAHLRWQPGDNLPHGARVVPFDGAIPEVFSCQTLSSS